jgi:ActR/RegA family two-component response regulator
MDDLRVEFASLEPTEGGARPTLAELQMRYIRRVLGETNGNKQAAARILGLSVRTLQRMQASMLLTSTPPAANDSLASP